MAGPRSKAKTGCRTCKTRKVKCDETFPECTRCLHAGRLCGGYGIWGGGSNGNANHIIRTSTTKRAYDTKTTSPPSHNPQTTSRTSHPTQTLSLKAPPPLISSAISTAHDREIFDYYLRLASTKLPGSFSHDFWSHAVMPATLSEPAVLHAVLALSCTHKRGVLSQPQSPLASSVATTTTHGIIGGGKGSDLETLALKHYVKAIGCLRPHFEANDVTSVQVALMVCVVFMALDSFAGRWDSARRHLETGLRLLRESYAMPDQHPSQYELHDVDPSLILLHPPRTMADKWLIQVFTSLQIQFGLFSPLSGPLLLPVDTEDGKREVFGNLLDAWHCLQRLLIRAMHLESVSKSLAKESEADRSNSHSAILQSLINHRGTLQEDVNNWLLTMQTSCSSSSSSPSKTITTECENSFETRKAYHVVMAYHCMVAIKTETCLRHIPPFSPSRSSNPPPPPHCNHIPHHNPESPFSDPLPISLFHTLLTHLCNLWNLAAPPPQYHIPTPQSLSHDKFDTLRSMMDFGWIPLLYFLAIKCRLRQIRSHASGFLGRVFHREGIWDGRVVAAVVSKVIEVEETGLVSGHGGEGHDDGDGDFVGDHVWRGRSRKGLKGRDEISLNLSVPPTKEDLQLPRNKPVPIQNQLVDVEMALSGDPIVQNITLIHTIIPRPPLQSSLTTTAWQTQSPAFHVAELDVTNEYSDEWNYHRHDNADADHDRYRQRADPRPSRESSRPTRIALAQYNLQTGMWKDFFSTP